MTFANRIQRSIESKCCREQHLTRRLMIWIVENLEDKDADEWFILCDAVWYMQIIQQMVDLQAGEVSKLLPGLYREPYAFSDPNPIMFAGVRIIHTGHTVIEGSSLQLLPNTTEGRRHAENRQFRESTKPTIWPAMGSHGTANRPRHEPNRNGVVPG